MELIVLWVLLLSLAMLGGGGSPGENVMFLLAAVFLGTWSTPTLISAIRTTSGASRISASILGLLPVLAGVWFIRLGAPPVLSVPFAATGALMILGGILARSPDERPAHSPR
jgi:hypothetical protein